MLTYSNTATPLELQPTGTKNPNHFNVLNKLELQLTLNENPYQFLATDLFEVAARVNPKRSFLFVSKLIGKHLDVHPDIPKATGMLLAHLFVERFGGLSLFDTNSLVEFVKSGTASEETRQALQTKHPLNHEDHTLFIGFAETATGLGHAVFSSFEHAHFIHTTREDLQMASAFDFQEEHSHATDHRCYFQDDAIMKNAQHIVLIDDEMTTGKTSLNLIRSLHAVYPKKNYTILCLLDWRSESEKQAYAELEDELQTTIQVVSFVSGSMEVLKEHFFEHPSEKEDSADIISRYRMTGGFAMPKVVSQSAKTQKDTEYLLYTGRFGLSSEHHDSLEIAAKHIGEDLKKYREGKKTLVLGMGEFMYLPSRIASYMGDNVTHKTTTRSPIYVSDDARYPIQSRISFQDDDEVTNYAYNLKENQYEEVFIMSEKIISLEKRGEIAACLNDNGIHNISYVFLSGVLIDE